jgi:hypothetical protein
MNGLITQGATGTHAVERALGDNLHRPRNWNHHQRNPDHEQFEGVDKVVYLFCNPYDHLLSLFRNCQSYNYWAVDHTKNCGGNWDWFAHFAAMFDPTDLNTFLTVPGDPIMYREHAAGYIRGGHSYDLLVCRYEILEENGLAPICDFFGIETPDWEFKQRNSNWEEEPTELRQLLHRKYYPVLDWYNALPLIQEVKSDSLCDV